MKARILLYLPLTVACAEPQQSVLETDLWPGEGRPRVVAVSEGIELHGAAESTSDSRHRAVPDGGELRWDQSLVRTTRAGRVAARQGTTLTGRSLGARRRLTTDEYYDAPSAPWEISIEPGDELAYLQDLPEGACFTSLQSELIEVDWCPWRDEGSGVFEVVARPETEWWIRVTDDGEGVLGWLLVDGSQARSAGTSWGMPETETGPLSVETEGPAVALELVKAEPSPRFPKSLWTFDVRLANRSAVARWFLIPDPLEKALDLARDADTIDVVELGPARGLAMLRIAATHNLVALRLAPGAEVKLSNLALTSWDERPVEAIEIWAVHQILLDGEPICAERLSGANLLVIGKAEVDASVERTYHGWLDPEMRAHPLGYEADERWLVEVILGDLPPPWTP